MRAAPLPDSRMLRRRRCCQASLTSFLGLLDFMAPFAAVGVDHATAATSKATVQRHGHGERVWTGREGKRELAGRIAL
jgi:hypothetical protein